MRRFEGLNNYEKAGPVVLSIGNFDGLHRGHQHLLEQNLALATQTGSRSVLLSFSPHPREVLGAKPFHPLCCPSEQLRLLEQVGLDDWIVEPFVAPLREESADEFLRRLLGSVPVRAIVVGSDFRFGRNREGDIEQLKKVGFSSRFDVHIPETLCVQGQKVSSSRIRTLLSKGDVQGASDLLGRVFSLKGVVKPGFHRGRQLGFPTANINTSMAGNLQTGVYATRVFVGGAYLKGVTNVGFHPTFVGEKEIQVETHILDFSENLYGMEIKVEFLSFLRPEKKFSDPEALREQIKKDIELVSQLASRCGETPFGVAKLE